MDAIRVQLVQHVGHQFGEDMKLSAHVQDGFTGP